MMKSVAHASILTKRMLNNPLTTYEAAKRAGFAVPYIRQLLAKGKLKGRHAKINNSKAIWLIDSASLKKYLSSYRQRGPKPKKK